MNFIQYYVKYIKSHSQIGDSVSYVQIFFGWLASEYQVDLFFPEENRMIEYFKEYCKKYSKHFDTTNYEEVN